MKQRRLLLALPLLPTITETLEDLPAHPASSAQGSAQSSAQSLDDYMSSIQALARPAETPSCGPLRLQRAPRLRQLSRAQTKLSPRTLRTPRPYSLQSANGTEDTMSPKTSRDCRDKDPVDWLFGQIRT